MSKEITLQEGLAQFQKKSVKYFFERPLSLAAKHFLLSHDIAHVVFGCSTAIYGEGVVKVGSTFGTGLGFGEVTNGYSEVNALSLHRDYSLRHIAKKIKHRAIPLGHTKNDQQVKAND